jgi:hypothetical protein
MVRAKSVSPREVASVANLPAPKRYAHLVNQCADWGAVWGLRGEDGWVSAQGDDNNLAFAVWPHEAYAQLCAVGEWSSTEPRAIEIHYFLESIVPGLLLERSQVAAFPTPAGSVAVVSVQRFVEDLKAELGRIE